MEISDFGIFDVRTGFVTASGFPVLPLGQLRGFDIVEHASLQGGRHGVGKIAATKDVSSYDWAFDLHFPNDPILPGLMLIESMLQLAGFWGGLAALSGKGRAIKVDGIRFHSEVLPTNKSLFFNVDIRKILRQPQIVIAEGCAFCDGVKCASVADMWVQIRR